MTPVESVIAEVVRIRKSLLEAEQRFDPQIRSTHPAWRTSARNLVHYIALRHHDIRDLQSKLAEMGLSSLGRSEGHVMATIDSVLGVLLRLSRRKHQVRLVDERVNFREGTKLLERNTRSLLGEEPRDRRVRIMVTMPREGAENYHLVRELIALGANCIRINCSRDGESVWRRMTENVRKASGELHRECKVQFDLPGRKLRTRDIGPGPRVIKWNPKRDSQGKIIRPARIWLTPEPKPTPPNEPADACIQVQANWLASLRVGSKLSLSDLRGKKRNLTVVGEVGESRWAEGLKTAYVGPETVLITKNQIDDEYLESKIGAIPIIEASVLLRVGDMLLLTSESRIAEGERISHLPRIGGLSKEVLSSIKTGQSIWFDDGKIGGVIDEKTDAGVHIRITHAKPEGTKLRANRGINLPDTRLNPGTLDQKDLDVLSVAAECADSVALSFAKSREDVETLLAHIDKSRRPIGIVLKIETRDGFEHLPTMLLATMRNETVGVMIARGDLAVECGYERLAEIQEEILWICEAARVPVIWATEVLENLAKTGVPSRAEITDAAMSVRAECVMLNKGPYVTSAVRTLDDILRRMQTHQRKKTSMLRKLNSLSLD